MPIGGSSKRGCAGPTSRPAIGATPRSPRAAFDEEGFYRLGDAFALRSIRPIRRKGFLFEGRLGEDFKLSTGTWVSVGTLRTRFIAHFAPFVRDVVIAGQDRDDIAVLVLPALDACRRLAPELALSASAADLLEHPHVRREFTFLLDTLARQGTGSSNRICRAILLTDQPSLDRGEITDKGSINQRAVLNHRTALVDDLYTQPPPPHVIAIKDGP